MEKEQLSGFDDFHFERERWIKRAGPIIRLAVEKGIIGTSIEMPDSFNKEFISAIEERYIPFIVARHQSHPDGFIIARLTLDLIAKTNKLNPDIKGFFMPLAQSLEEGQQDRSMMRVYHEIKPTMRKFALVPTPIVRKKDMDKNVYGMRKDDDEEARMRNLLREGYQGVMLFPEGTTTGGKTTHEVTMPNGEIINVNNKNGQVNGMVAFEENSIKKTYLFLKRNLGKEVLFIPAATFGGRKILNPDNKWVSPILLVESLISPYPHIAGIRVGKAFRSNEESVAALLKDRDRTKINEFIGREIAKLIPPYERGVYA